MISEAPQPAVRQSSPARVEPETYTSEYYATSCHGHEDFAATAGQRVGPRFVKALSLAGSLRGKRTLDVGCGRGELVVQPAMRGAEAWGIDYADAAVEIAAGALDGIPPDVRSRTHIASMDVKALEFPDAYFDVAFMLDVVEHLYPHELDAALAEVHRVLRPGGRLVLHTSPNKVFERFIYPTLSRHVNGWFLAAAQYFERRDLLFNEMMLPTRREFPHGEYERAMHINEQSASTLRTTLRARGFGVRGVEFWEPPLCGPYFPTDDLNGWLWLLDFMRFLRPISRYPPLSRWFCNHIWMTAEKR